MPFFEAIGGPKDPPTRDLDEGDIVWLAPYVTEGFRLAPGHWEVLSLEASNDKLLSAETVRRRDFETALRAKSSEFDERPNDRDRPASTGVRTIPAGRLVAPRERRRTANARGFAYNRRKRRSE